VEADPPVPADSGSGRRVIYSIGQQRVWLVTGSGEVDATYLVSGRLSQPGPGSYRVYSRSRHARSAVSDATMQYMVRFAHGARTGAPIGFHDIPRRFDGSYEQSVAELGQPLSAGCIRQSIDDARRLWGFAPVGTTVVVVG
jgi:lipoprotein-anchoring transpeptidase ErfK/SrfK